MMSQVTASGEKPAGSADGSKPEHAAHVSPPRSQSAPAVAQDSSLGGGSSVTELRQPANHGQAAISGGGGKGAAASDHPQAADSGARGKITGAASLAATSSANSQALTFTAEQLPPLPDVQPSHMAEAEESWQHAAQVSHINHVTIVAVWTPHSVSRSWQCEPTAPRSATQNMTMMMRGSSPRQSLERNSGLCAV